VIDFDALHTQALERLRLNYEALMQAEEAIEEGSDVRSRLELKLSWRRNDLAGMAPTWFESCRVSSLEDGVVRLRCPRRLTQEVLNYLTCFEDAFSEVLGHKVSAVLQGNASGGDDCLQHAKLPPKSPLGHYEQKQNLPSYRVPRN
jgi:hypothetical protein